MPRHVILARRALRDFDTLPTDDQRRMRDALRSLEANPRLVDFKKLEGQQEMWRLRVGRWRALIRWSSGSETLSVERIEPRDRAYR